MNTRSIIPVGPFLCFARMSCVSIVRFFWSSEEAEVLSLCRNITTSASCSIDPDSRKSAKDGCLPSESRLT